MTDVTQDTSTATNDAGGTQTTDQPADTAQAAANTDTTKTTEAVTEVEYKFDAPEGVAFDQGDLDKFTALAKEHKLPADVAKKVVDLAAQREIARADAFAKQVETWGNEVKADPELGKPENLAIAKKFIDTFGDDTLRDLLNTTGMGNHPAVVRMMLKGGRAISEDTFVSGRGNGNAPPAQSLADRLYGAPNKS